MSPWIASPGPQTVKSRPFTSALKWSSFLFHDYLFVPHSFALSLFKHLTLETANTICEWGASCSTKPRCLKFYSNFHTPVSMSGFLWSTESNLILAAALPTVAKHLAKTISYFFWATKRSKWNICVIGMDTKQERRDPRLHMPEPMSRLNNHLLPNSVHSHLHMESLPSEERLPDPFSPDQTKQAQRNTEQMVTAMEKIKGQRDREC